MSIDCFTDWNFFRVPPHILVAVLKRSKEHLLLPYVTAETVPRSNFYLTRSPHLLVQSRKEKIPFEITAAVWSNLPDVENNRNKPLKIQLLGRDWKSLWKKLQLSDVAAFKSNAHDFRNLNNADENTDQLLIRKASFNWINKLEGGSGHFKFF